LGHFFGIEHWCELVLIRYSYWVTPGVIFALSISILLFTDKLLLRLCPGGAFYRPLHHPEFFASVAIAQKDPRITRCSSYL
jgi:hypothetical protein